MIRILWILLSSSCILLNGFLEASEASDWNENIQISGHIKSYFMATDQADVEGDPSTIGMIDGFADNKFRLKLLWNPTDIVTFELAYALMPIIRGTNYQSTISFLDIENDIYRIEDIDQQIYPDQDDAEGSFILTNNLDRAVVTFSPGFGDIHIGRQAISFGMARVINPTDIIAPYNFNELDVENRVGVDAARLTLPIGDLGEFDAGMIFGEEGYIDHSAYYILTKLYIKQTDVSFIVMDFKENLMGGVNLSRSVKGAGVWLEAAYTWAQLLSDHDKEQDYFRATIGMDYNINFKNSILVFLEYHYNGASSGDPKGYLWQVMETSKIAYQQGSTFLLGEHYLAPGFSTQLSPLISVSGIMLINVTDSSLFFLPQLEYNMAENLYVTIGAGISAGRGSRLDSDNLFDLPVLDIESEFGLYPEFYFASVKIYF